MSSDSGHEELMLHTCAGSPPRYPSSFNLKSLHFISVYNFVLISEAAGRCHRRNMRLTSLNSHRFFFFYWFRPPGDVLFWLILFELYQKWAPSLNKIDHIFQFLINKPGSPLLRFFDESAVQVMSPAAHRCHPLTVNNSQFTAVLLISRLVLVAITLYQRWVSD